MRPSIIALVGPTAVGKTKAAVAVCKALGGEVLSMDSMQVYKGMDIGTAKPSEAERGGVAHHLLDIVSPAEAFSVSQYRDMAQAVIEDIRARGRIPVLVGGTGLYLDALTRPMKMAVADEDNALRQRLKALAQTAEGRRTLHAQLALVDPESAERLHENDVRRVVRALEVYESTGKTMSEHRREDEEGEGLYTPLIYALTLPRETLYARINKRVNTMCAAGLVQEVQGLLDAGMMPERDGALQAIGYKEIVRALCGETSLEDAIEQIKMNSRRYAKRQLTWFRRDTRVRWLDISEYADFDAAVGALIGQIRVDWANQIKSEERT